MGQLAIAGRNASVDAVNTQLNGGTVEIRTGTAAAIDSAPTGTVLATFTIAATAFGAASSGSSTANAISDVTAGAAGTQIAGHYVAKTSGGAAARNGAVGIELTINNTSITNGDNVSITSWTYAQATG
jgi:hypothetical protein